ncbi:MAG: hypothetical protein ACE5KK_01915 [Candidatus Brocadiales bacterium]
MTRNPIMLSAILVVLRPLGIYKNLKNFRGGGERVSSTAPMRRPPNMPPPAAEAPAKTEGRGSRPFQPVEVNKNSFKQLVASGKWGRNPFLTKAEIRRSRRVVSEEPTVVTPDVTTEEGPPEYIPELNISSVLISDEEKVAVIDGEFYAEGDLIPATGELVMAITPDGVILEGVSGQRLLSLSQSSVRLGIKER